MTMASLLSLGSVPGHDADDVRGHPLAGNEMRFHFDFGAEIEGERSLEAERLADQVPPALLDEVERVVEEIATRPHDDEALGALTRSEHAGARPPLAGLARFAGRREVHLDETDGALPGRGLDLFAESPGGLGIRADGFGDVGQDQDDLALDVERRVVVPAVLLCDDAVAGEDEPAADDARTGAVDGREVAAAAGVIDAMGRRQDLETDRLLEVRPRLERDFLEKSAVVAARLEPGLPHFGGHVLGGPAVLRGAGFASLEVVRGEEGDMGERFRAVGRGPDRGRLGRARGRYRAGRREGQVGGQGDERDEQSEKGSRGAAVGGSFHDEVLWPSFFRASAAALPKPSDTVGWL